MVLQETYEVLDAIFYDKGTSDSYNNNWINTNYTVSRDSTGTTIKDNQASGWVNYKTPSISFPTSETIVMEFDIVDYLGNVFFQLTDATGPHFDTNVSTTAPYHVKLEMTASTIKRTVGTSTNTFNTSDYMDGTAFQFVFAQNNNGRWLKYSNFKVYSV